MNSFGQRLKSFRKEKKLSQSDLASLVGVGQTTIANYEKDIRFPNEAILKSIAGALSVSLDQLLDVQIKKDISIDNYDLETLSDTFMTHILNDEIAEAKVLVMNLRNDGVALVDIFSKFFKLVQYKVGRLWEIGEVSIGFEHHVTSIIEELVALFGTEYDRVKEHSKTAIFLTPSNEPHLLGLKIIKEIFRSYGWKTYFLGSNIPWKSVVDLAVEKQSDMICISVTMPEHLNQTKSMIEYLKSNLSCDVMVGGQAFLTRKFVLDEINSDYYTENETEIIDLLNKIT